MRSWRDFFGSLFGRGERPSVPENPPGAGIPGSSHLGAASSTAARHGPTLDGAPVWPRGKIIGGIYEIRDVVGRGGMGLVYRAYDHATHQDIAVKVPLGRWDFDAAGRKRLVRFVDSPEAKKDLLQEVRHWMALAHPHLVRALDVHDDESTDYLPAICMEYCEGGSLADRIYAGGGLTLAEGLDIAIQVCWAMEYVHEKGLVHRDLKPLNVLLKQDGSGRLGRALVTDLGLAKATGVRGADAAGPPMDAQEAALWVTVSQAGGTPPYMPPEQWASGAHVGPASDVYAFGVMLYELMCARLPFQEGSQLGAWQRAHCQQPAPDPRQWNRELPESLSWLMRECLAKEPGARPQRFGELGQRLGGIYREVTGRDYAAVRSKPERSVLTADARRAQAWAKVRLGIGAYRRGDLNAAEQEYREAAGVFKALGDKAGLSSCYGNQAVILQDWGRLEEAMRLLKHVQALCEELGDKAGLSTCYGNQALILKAWGRLEEAMRLLKQQQALCEESGEKAGLSTCYGNQALILRAWGRLEEAMHLHKQEQALCEELGDKAGLSACYGNQALILQAWGRLEEAMHLLNQQQALCEELGDKAGLQRTYGNQALILQAWGRLEEAMRLHKEKQALCEELGDPNGLAISLANQALILGLKLGRQAEALTKVQQALRLCQQAGLSALAAQVQGIQDAIVQGGGR